MRSNPLPSPSPRSPAWPGAFGLGPRGLGVLALMGWLGVPSAALAHERARGAAAQHREPAERPYRLELRIDTGFLAVLDHDYQKGRSGTSFDYTSEGGQDVLFHVSRFGAGLELGRHRISITYQPLALRTREVLRRDIVVDGTLFPAGSEMEFSYGFPFYRVGYDYALRLDEDSTLRLGGALQVRNASIEFATLDGERFVSRRDVGPVPLLHAGLRTQLGPLYWVELEVDGIYAPVRYLNGDDNGVEGALIDANARFGLNAHDSVDAFVNARYLAGGAEGSDGSDPDAYTSNWLQFFILSVGVAVF